MKTLIRKLLLRASIGIVGVTGATLAIFFTIGKSIESIQDSFYLSAAFLALAPALTFMIAFAYHYWVVGPIKQLCAVDTRHLSAIQKPIIESAQEIIGFSRLIPILFSGLALMLAVIIAPGILISAGLEPGNAMRTVFISVLVAGQLILAARIIRQIYHAVQYIRGNLQ